jgi:hypothetical protein
VYEDFREIDEFGIPLNWFGPVSEPFYATIGRVTHVAAFLDTKMLELLRALCDNDHNTFNNRYGQQLEELVGKAASFVSEELAEDVREMLVEAERLREWRNDIIHSVWPNPTDEHAFAWRPRDSAARTFVTNGEEVRAVIKDMIKLIDDIGRLIIGAQPEKSARMNEGRPKELPTTKRDRAKAVTS